MKRDFTRWKKNEAVQSIRRSRIFLKNRYFDVRTQPKILTHARLLVVTSKKSGNAVERNLFRRRLVSLFYEYALYQGDFDWIIFAKPGISELTFTNLRELIISLLQSSSVPLSSFLFK